MKIKFIYSFFILIACLQLSGQNLITVPFNNGFVGDNGGSKSATTCYYHSGAGGLGWSNVQFAQNPSTYYHFLINS